MSVFFQKKNFWRKTKKNIWHQTINKKQHMTRSLTWPEVSHKKYTLKKRDGFAPLLVPVFPSSCLLFVYRCVSSSSISIWFIPTLAILFWLRRLAPFQHFSSLFPALQPIHLIMFRRWSGLDIRSLTPHHRSSISLHYLMTLWYGLVWLLMYFY